MPRPSVTSVDPYLLGRDVATWWLDQGCCFDIDLMGFSANLIISAFADGFITNVMSSEWGRVIREPTEISWTTDFDFQRNNLVRWMARGWEAREALPSSVSPEDCLRAWVWLDLNATRVGALIRDGNSLASAFISAWLDMCKAPTNEFLRADFVRSWADLAELEGWQDVDRWAQLSDRQDTIRKALGELGIKDE